MNELIGAGPWREHEVFGDVRVDTVYSAAEDVFWVCMLDLNGKVVVRRDFKPGDPARHEYMTQLKEACG